MSASPVPASEPSRGASRRRARGGPRRALATMTAVVAGLVAACGIPADSGFEENDELNVGPDSETTVATTTTATTTPDSPPPSTLPTAPPGSPSTSNGDPVGLTEPVTLYFVGGTPQNETLSESTRALSYPAQLQQVVSALVEGPPERESPGLRTLIDDDLVRDLTVDQGVLTIDLNGEEFFDLGETTTQRSAIGQLVLTFGRRPGVGQVTFTQDGEPHPVQVPLEDGSWQSRSQPVSADAFSPMLAESQLSPETATTGPDDDVSDEDDDTSMVETTTDEERPEETSDDANDTLDE